MGERDTRLGASAHWRCRFAPCLDMAMPMLALADGRALLPKRSRLLPSPASCPVGKWFKYKHTRTRDAVVRSRNAKRSFHWASAQSMLDAK